MVMVFRKPEQAGAEMGDVVHRGGGEAALSQPCRIKPPIGRPLRLSVAATDPDLMITSMRLDDSTRRLDEGRFDAG